MNLKECFDKYKCDKSWRHHYYKVYEPAFEKRKNDKINFLEVGVLEGRSTKALLDYFPNMTYYGIDIFARVPIEDLKDITENSRVHLLNHDSTSDKLPSAIKEAWGDISFDFIIDDAVHWPEYQIPTFLNCIEFLKGNGYFWIEDCFHPKYDIPSEHEKLINAIKKSNTCKSMAKQSCVKFSRDPESVIYEMIKKD
tara:strand:+ start:3381 stop:3968 length:588 start_codon:yes stop_codon:yes gene_type:complete